MTWYYRFPLTLVTLLLTPVQPNIQDADLTKKKKKRFRYAFQPLYTYWERLTWNVHNTNTHKPNTCRSS